MGQFMAGGLSRLLHCGVGALEKRKMEKVSGEEFKAPCLDSWYSKCGVCVDQE